MKKWLLSLMLISFSSFGGNGSSGGGNIFGDQINPWFFQNTTDVTYCLELDDNFSLLSRETVLANINQAFNFWKKKFANVKAPGVGLDPMPQVATQNFIYEACSPKTDIRFQMGHLTSDQQKKFNNIDQIIGMAFRESYDQKNMHGKGYIYIAPERGSLRPSSLAFADRPWSSQEGKESPLLLALAHEIGHVFGLQDDHTSLDSFDLMSSHFVENITQETALVHAPQLEHFQPLGLEGKTFSRLISMSQDQRLHVRKFLGIPSSAKTLIIDGEGDRVVLKAGNGQAGNETLIGSFTIKIDPRKMSNLTYQSRVRAWLPKNQVVFKAHWGDRKASPYYDIVMVHDSFILTDMTYSRADGVKHKIDVAINKGWINFNAMIHGKYEHDVLTAKF
jgi:hypothetical protein